ncbi:hypothetical protein APHAL10511_006285 [Amanita phalloides]|nr:hypothetical protein APHAL10511_006285 [Amanita phalloides]
MDQESCSFLFKRWSEDYESFQKLRHQFASLQQQYDSLFSQFQALQQDREKEVHARSIAAQDASLNKQDTEQREYETLRQLLDSSTAEVQFLKDQNHDLHQALRRHEEQAANSAQSNSKLREDLQKLGLENANISKQRDQLSQKCEEMVHKYEDLQRNVNMAHDANKNIEDQTAEATRKMEFIYTELARVTAIANQFEEVEASHKQMVASYEKQIQDMVQLLRAKDVGKKALSDELANCRDHLQKLRDSNKSLTSTVANIVNKLNGTHTSSTDTTQARPITHQQSSQKNISTAALNKQQSEGIGSNKPCQKPGNTTQCQTICGSQLASSTTQAAPQTALIPAAMPLARRQMFDGFAPVVPDVTNTGEKEPSERNFLKATIGGAIQSLIVRVANSQTPLAKARCIATYLCPSLDHNPWCPITPGEHGYMFVGLGQEKDTFLEPQDYNVFVGLLKSKNNEHRKYRYMGVYRAVRVSPLIVDEWNTLSESRKRLLMTKGIEANSIPLSVSRNKGASPSAKKRRMSNEESTHGTHKRKITFV